MRSELAEAKLDLEKAASTLASVRQQYFEQQEELNEDKIALGFQVDECRTTAAELRHELKKAEAFIAYLNTKLSALESGARGKDAVLNDLQMKRRQGNLDEEVGRPSRNSFVMRSPEPSARSVAPSRTATKPLRPSIGLRWRMTSTSSGGSEEPGSPRTAVQADRRRTRPVPATACSADLRERRRHQSEDIPTDTPQPPARKPSEQTPRGPEQTPHRGSRDKQSDEAGTAITAIA